MTGLASLPKRSFSNSSRSAAALTLPARSALKDFADSSPADLSRRASANAAFISCIYFGVATSVIGVGLLSTFSGWKDVNTSHLMEAFRDTAPERG